MKKMTKLTMLLSILGLILTGCSQDKSENKTTASEPTIKTSMFGNVTAAKSYTLFAPIAGTINGFDLNNGQEVNLNDLLFQINSGEETAQVNAKSAGVVTNISVAEDQPIQAGEPLAILMDDSQKELLVEADEVDLAKIRVGDAVDIELDSQPDEQYEGKIEYISAIGEEQQNATYYEVQVSFNPDKDVLLGMSATVFIRK
ncbi:HlyD family efflux transporter periplasmic adaptor subunit [Enterococcus sp. AZ103]|uniref:HlyD family secretion protein n=1 Tax=Enterococcus sp. AZ103 TaxID=2774628 RepID=UPI003F1FF77D